MKVRLKKLEHFRGELPKYQSRGSSGCDVTAAIDSEIVVKPTQRVLVPTGLCCEIPEGFEIQVRPRSGLAIKSGIALVNAPGTIDSDYRGEVKIILINLGDSEFTIRPGDRIAQLVLAPVIQAEFEVSEDLSETSRGIGGFGSTGVSGSRPSPEPSRFGP